jgi:hypothetical protein
MSTYQPKLSEHTATTVERKNDDGVIVETKENLTEMRRFESRSNFMKGNDIYTEFEKAYGKYLYIPFDIPKIQPKDLEYFVSWYYDNARHASKQIEDFSSGTFQATNRTYQTVDSVSPGWTPVWTLNSKPEVYTLFPELFEQIHEYMPWVGGTEFRWNMWSSNANVPTHRDHTSCIDAPLAMRIKLFDGNPFETLSLLTDPMVEHSNKYRTLPNLKGEDTNSFTWNNLRTKHKSTFLGPNHRKILFIWRDALRTEKQVQQFADLMDRSIARYGNNPNLTWIDSYSASDYIDVKSE